MIEKCGLFFFKDVNNMRAGLNVLQIHMTTNNSSSVDFNSVTGHIDCCEGTNIANISYYVIF